MSLGKRLIVDDELDVRHLLCDFLRGRDYEVLRAGDGLDGMGMVERMKPDLVLLDVVMPGMNGVETLRRIAEIDPPLRVIMVTANSYIGLTSRLLAMGAVDYIPKPFDLDYLEQAVNIQLAASE